MKLKWPCILDPVKLGIEDDQGNWDHVKLAAHLDECELCRNAMEAIARMIEDGFLDCFDEKIQEV